MATTVVKTIGSTGDYTTIAAWVAAIPANLVTADQVWQGQLLNEEFSVAGEVFNIAGKTTDSTRYIELTTAPGCSVFDDVNVRSNPLRFNTSFGARIKRTNSYGYACQVSVANTRINKLQIINAATGVNAGAAIYATGAGIDIDRCILESSSRLVSEGTMYLAYGKVRNSLIVNRDTLAASIIARLYQGASAYNCDFIGTADVFTNGVITDYGSPVLKNVYIRGAANPNSGGVTPTKINCYASVAATGFTLAAYSTATFVSVTNGTEDWRLASGSPLIDTGADETTNAATDISGTARSAGSYDVGAWEASSSGGGASTAISATTANAVGSMSSNPVPRTAIGATTANSLGSITSASGSFSTTVSATTANAVGSLSSSGSTANGTFTSEVLKDYAGNVLASVALNYVRLYNDTTGALVLNKTGISTNGSGIVSFSDPALVSGTTYRVDWETSSGSRRMPRKAAA